MKTLALLALSLLAALAADLASADHLTGTSSVPVCGRNDGRPAVGVVVALSGAATAAAQDCPPLPVACDATVRAGDHVVTAPGANVALRAGGRYVQLGPDSELVASRTSEGAPDLTLLRGRARIVAEEEVQVGPPPRIATPDLETLSPGDDTEALAEADPARSSLCSWAGPIRVRPTAGGAAIDANTGECVGAQHGAGPSTSAGGALAVSLLDAARCGVADLGELTPFEVAAGPPVPGFPVAPFNLPPTPYCQGGACSGTHGSPPPSHVPVVESPAGFEPPP